MGLRIVLVGTQGALNLGSVARVMNNMGLQRLHLVKPECSPQDPEAIRMAVHSRSILDNAQIYGSLPDALKGCQAVFATCGRIDLNLTTMTPDRGIATLKAFPESGLVFGAEDRGLSKEELQYCQGVIQIPTVENYPSLNLAQAVGICCYEWRRLELAPDPSPPPIETAPIESIEGLFQHLEQVLLDIGYLYPHTAFARMQKFRKIVHRSQLTQGEVAMVRGILSQVGWAIKGGKNHE